MIPQTITLEGFRSYREAVTVDFTGLRRACIIGANGSGKSTIITAMLWALFGKSSVHSNSELINSASASMRVEFDFLAGDKIYRIARSLRRGKGAVSAELWLVDSEPKLIAEGVREADSAIRKLLGLEYEDFISASVLVQGGSARFSLMSPAQRKAFMAKLLGISLCEEISKLARARSREIEAERRAREDERSRLESQDSNAEAIEQTLHNAQAMLDVIESSIAAEKSSLHNLREQKAEFDKKKLELDSIEASIVKEKSELDLISSEISDEKNRLDKFAAHIVDKPAVSERILALGEAENALAKLDAHFAKYISHKEIVDKEERAVAEWEMNSKNRLKSLELEKRPIVEELDRLEKELAKEPAILSKHKRFIALASTIADFERKFAEAEPIRRSILELSSQIELEERKITASVAEIEAKIRELGSKIDQGGLDALRAEAKRIEAKLADEPEIRDKLEDSRQKWEASKSRANAIEAEKTQLIKQLENSSDKLKMIKSSEESECPLCGQSLEGRHRELVVTDLETAVEDISRRINELSEESFSLSRSLAQIEAEGKALRKQSEDLKLLDLKAKEIALKIESLEAIAAERSELSRRLGELRATLEGEDFLKTESESLASLRTKLNELAVPEDLISATKNEIESLRENEVSLSRLGELKSRRLELLNNRDRLDSEINSSQAEFAKREEIADKLDIIEAEKRAISELNYDSKAHAQARKTLEELRPYRDILHSIEVSEAKYAEIKKLLTSLKHRCANSERRILEFSAQKASLEPQLSKIREFNEFFLSAERHFEESVEQLHEAEIVFKMAQEDFKRALIIRQELKTIKAKIAELNERERIHRLLAELMGKSGVPAFVISHSIPEIEREADNLLTLVSGDQLSLKLASEEGDDLRVLIADSEGERPYDSYSGGESFRIDFALRLALSRFLARRSGAELTTLIIDEGFGSQDAEGLSLLIEALRAVEGEFEMILVITHLEGLKEEFDQIIEVSKRSSRGSEVRVFA